LTRARSAPRCALLVLAAIAAVVVVPARADAQWYLAVFMGANHTTPATVSIDQPSKATSLDFHDVTFEARPFQAPQYYGYRFGQYDRSRKFAFEVEFIHLKVISQTSHTVHVTGQLAGAAVDENVPMNTLVERYQMTHGLNFFLFNLKRRIAIKPRADRTSRASILAGGGFGFTTPHAESTIAGVTREQYEYAGVGFDGAAGLEVRLRDHFAVVADYKVTYAKPKITIDGGTGQTSALSHQVAFGVAFHTQR
jgi:hypothetical protein